MSAALTEDQLRQIAPNCGDVPLWVRVLSTTMDHFDIVATRRQAAFLAQVAFESGDFTRLEESLSYSAARLTFVWPNRFPTLAAAQPYARNPQALANRVYAGRMGNGDATSGDGWRFRGRGVIQITGRNTYRTAGQGLRLDLEGSPDLLLDPQHAADSAGLFWQLHGLNELADHRDDARDDEDFTTISIRINGGRQGLAKRIARWRTAQAALAVNRSGAEAAPRAAASSALGPAKG